MVSERPAEEVVASHAAAAAQSEAEPTTKHITFPTFQRSMVKSDSLISSVELQTVVCRVQQCLTWFQAQRRGRTIPTSLPVRICWGLESLISKN